MTSPLLTWDIGTAYDLFVSLHTLHHPGDFGLRGSWAVGVRSRLPQESREFLQEAMEFVAWPLDWVHSLPDPKSSREVFEVLHGLRPEERLPQLSGVKRDSEDPVNQMLWQVADTGQVTADLEAEVFDLIQQRYGDKKTKSMKKGVKLSLQWWARLEQFGDHFLTALEAYYDSFYQEDERRIRPAMEDALARAQQLAENLSIADLLQELSQGVQFNEPPQTKELVLAPTFWGSPLLLLGPTCEDRQIILFGGRPADASIVPGDPVPDTLYQSLKALADPTRLKILKYLMEEPLTPSELATRLRLRPPTVVHHLQTLRLARLVMVTYEDEGKRYRARHAAVRETSRLLDKFLGVKEREVATIF